MKENKEIKISILNKIKNKPLIIEKIFPFTIKRLSILYDLIRIDNILKAKLNNIFSDVPKYKNSLPEEFQNNLILYPNIEKIYNELNKCYNKLKKNSYTYTYIKDKLNFSFIGYIFNQLIANKKLKKINIESLKGILFDFYSTLPNISLIFSPNIKNNLEESYFNYINTINKYSKERNKTKQNIRLILIIDENYFYNKITEIIKYLNIKEIELFLEPTDESYSNLFLNLNNYLSNIEYLHNINKIIIHNKNSNNYYTDNNTKITNNLYQSLLSYLFDGYYLEEKKDIKNQIKLINNVKEINIENFLFLYIYEQLKIYYFIYDIFPSFFSKYLLNTNTDIHFYLIDKILLIINNNTPFKLKEFILFVNNQLKKNNIEYLFIINNNDLINEENNINNEKIDLSNLKELMIINNNNNNEFNKNEQLLKDLFICNEEYNSYEGYDENNKLIFYRNGNTIIQSFDLIDLFKYNKYLTIVKLIKENIIINYNIERTKLKILNMKKIKYEYSDVINLNNHLYINHFSQFIYNQNKLEELTINRFDYNLNEIKNNNIKILNINYEKDILIMKYKNEDEVQNKINELFPHLVNLNIGGKINWILNIPMNQLPEKLKSIKMVSTFEKNSKFSRFSKKLKKLGKEIYYEFLESEIKEDEAESENDNYNNNEEDEFDESVVNDKKLPSKKINFYFEDVKTNIKEKYNIKIQDLNYEKIMKENFKNISIFEYSEILKTIKINPNILQKFKANVDKNLILKEIKFIYRASDERKSIKKLINAATQLKDKKFLAVIITSSTNFLIFPCCERFDIIYDFNENSFHQGFDDKTIKFVKDSPVIKIGYNFKNIDEEDYDIKDYELFEVKIKIIHSEYYHIPIK